MKLCMMMFVTGLLVAGCGGGGSSSGGDDDGGDENGDGNQAITEASRFTRYAVTADSFGLAVFALNVTNGQVELADTDSGVDQPVDIELHPSGEFVYAANFGSGDISQFAIGTDGRLTPLAPARVSSGSMVALSSLVVHPGGKYAYSVRSSVSGVEVYDIDANGVMTFRGVDPVLTGSLEQISLTPDGNYAYIIDPIGFNLVQLGIAADGSMATLPTDRVNTDPVFIATDMAIDPDGRFVYLLHEGGGFASQFSIGPTGELSPLTPATLPTGNQPRSISLGPSGEFAYITNGIDDNVTQYRIESDGQLAPLAPASIATGDSPDAIGLEPGGQYAYVSNQDFSYNVYRVLETGRLEALEMSTFRARGQIMDIAFVTGSAPPLRSARNAYAVNRYSGPGSASPDEQISQYMIGADGALQPLNPAVVTTGSYTTDIAADPSRQYLYTASLPVAVNQLGIADDGKLTLLGPSINLFSTGILGPRSIAVAPSGYIVYLAGDGGVVAATIGTDGLLTVGASVALPAGTSVTDLAVHVTGLYVYVTDYNTGLIYQFNESGNGTLTAMTTPTVTAGPGVSSINLDPTGRYAYAASFGGDIYQYSIDPANGSLGALAPSQIDNNGYAVNVAIDPRSEYAYIPDYNLGNPGKIGQYAMAEDGQLSALNPSSVVTGDNASRAVVDPTGRFLYAPNSDDDNLSQFGIGADGTLTPLTPATVPTGELPLEVIVTGEFQ